MILYGSYARGDYTEDSDSDIMILVDLPNEEMDSYLNSLSEIGFQYNVEHDIWINSICSVLVKEGIALKRHKDTISYFDKNYIHAGIFPRKLGRKIVTAEEIRHTSDYDTFYIASKEITAQQTAEKLLVLVAEYLEK
jgi:predicted nucleotidyltransferase